MAKDWRAKKWQLSDEEIEKKVAEFRGQLAVLNGLQTELLEEGVYGTYYTGSTQTYLPETVHFKRNRTETFG
jgi:hypothetical protein